MSSCRIVVPSVLAFPRAGVTFSNQTLSSASHKVAYAFNAQATTTINALGIRVGTITGTTPTYQVEIQGIGPTGLPDGTGVIGSSATFNPSALGWTAGTFQWLNISGVNLTRGTNYALVVRHSSGTADASNNAGFTTVPANVPPESIANPYILTDTGAGFTRIGSLCEPVFGYRDNTETYGNPIQAWNTGSLAASGHRAALKVALDAAWGSTFKVRGLFIHWADTPAASTCKYGVWDAAGAEIASVTLDSDQFGWIGGRQSRIFFNSVPTLNFGTTYYYGVERVGNWNPSQKTIEVSNNRDLEAYPLGSGAILATWDGSAWTDVPTQVFPMSLLFDDWSKPAVNTSYVSMITG